MARPIKQGLDYFPLDTEWDIKMQLVKARFGLQGVGCIIELYKMIYHEGYALKWDADTRLLFSADNKIPEEELERIVVFATDKGVFHAGKLDKLGVLTSSGIQKRWLRIVKEGNRTIKELDKDIALIDWYTNPIPETPLIVPLIPQKNTLPVLESTQSKVKEIIGKEREREEPIFVALNPTTKKDGSARIELARNYWNTKAPAIGPACRLTSITFKPEDTSDCLRVMTAYEDDLIFQAMDNYADLLASAEHEIKSPYRSFVGFIRGGVEKFVSEANPFEAFRVKAPAWKPEREGALDERPDATTPEEIAQDNARAAEDAMSPEEYQEALGKLSASLRPKPAIANTA